MTDLKHFPPRFAYHYVTAPANPAWLHVSSFTESGLVISEVMAETVRLEGAAGVMTYACVRARARMYVCVCVCVCLCVCARVRKCVRARARTCMCGVGG